MQKNCCSTYLTTEQQSTKTPLKKIQVNIFTIVLKKTPIYCFCSGLNFNFTGKVIYRSDFILDWKSFYDLYINISLAECHSYKYTLRCKFCRMMSQVNNFISTSEILYKDYNLSIGVWKYTNRYLKLMLSPTHTSNFIGWLKVNIWPIHGSLMIWPCISFRSQCSLNC
jgi:hypothetical protein